MQNNLFEYSDNKPFTAPKKYLIFYNIWLFPKKALIDIVN